ncbi:DUF4328 domain-containing protein [Erythrobacter sp. HKB08]|uniref:DUF4328 domain-containing protein n=1 Tax=Erythrobacter sp. HKB08 TaxID=2502843 RepID=UPI001008C433|nr:DUF4328 domain-containing protein [Erythrobacter sp. HKB08]
MLMRSSRGLAMLAFRSRLVQIAGWAFIAASLVQLAVTAYIMFRPPPPIIVTAGGGSPEPNWMVFLPGIVGLVWLASAMFLSISLLIWIYRAHSNLSEQGVEMDYGAGWAVGSYFIPFVNLVVPFRAMRELHNRSQGEIPEHAHSGVEDVAAWWTAYLVAIAVQTALIFKLFVNVFTNLILYTPVWMEFAMGGFATLLLAGATFLLLKLVRSITAAQSDSMHVGATFE